jgi:hypothetical protein
MDTYVDICGHMETCVDTSRHIGLPHSGHLAKPNIIQHTGPPKQAQIRHMCGITVPHHGTTRHIDVYTNTYGHLKAKALACAMHLAKRLLLARESVATNQRATDTLRSELDSLRRDRR